MLTNIAILLLTIGAALGQIRSPPNTQIMQVSCREYIDGGKWRSEGALGVSGTASKDSKEWSGWSSVNGGYTYTYTAGVGMGGDAEKPDVLSTYAEVIRTNSKGLGQQFRISFNDNNMKQIRSYWISPNVRCHIQDGILASQVGSVTVFSQI